MSLSVRFRRMIALAVMGIILISGCSNAQNVGTTTTTSPEPNAEVREAFERVCSQCHGLQNAQGEEITPPGQGGPVPSLKGRFFKVSARDWEATVKRMREGNNCPMTDGEFALITEYLNEQYGR